MYWTHWGLHQAPFRPAAGSELLHLSPTHDEALARLHFLVENRRRVGVLLGEGGAGKSLMLERFGRELRSEGVAAFLVNGFGVGVGELVWSVATGVGLNPRRDEPLHLLWGRVSDRLLERRFQQLATVMLVDDADRASEQALAAVVRLTQLDSSPESSLTVVLAAHTRRLSRLGSRLLDLVELRVDLDPWSAEETADYVEQSLAKAGREAPLFNQEAIARLHDLAQGRPRRVGQLADLALVAAAGQDLATIDEHTIENVYRELVTPLTPAPAGA
ncbi:MAG: AAA family ATPase [Planctomycetes bacterium]|nr:AAA family ATPase [Planctomycetota bacterium]